MKYNSPGGAHLKAPKPKLSPCLPWIDPVVTTPGRTCCSPCVYNQTSKVTSEFQVDPVQKMVRYSLSITSPGLTPLSCVTLGRRLHLSEPQLDLSKLGADTVPLSRGCGQGI